jgi:hypothetical protein
VHLLPAPAHDNANPFDFSSTDKLIELGYEAAVTALAGESVTQLSA